MTANRFGQIFSLTTFGESHGHSLGAVIEGCPAGVSVDLEILMRALARRRPGQSNITTARQELDQPEILSGVFEGRTLGTPIAVVVRNQDAKSSEYSSEKMQLRPGHATDLWQEKFGHSDPRGSGRASGRETLARVIGGAFAQMFLKQACPEIQVAGFVASIGDLQLTREQEWTYLSQIFADAQVAEKFTTRCPNSELHSQMESRLLAAKQNGNSYGGVAIIGAHGVPVGLGEPIFSKLKSTIAAGFMSVGATMGIEIGLGFDSAVRDGIQFHKESRNYGGIRGGISTGGDIFTRTAFKPTSTLGKMASEGRHDPCIVPRAIPVLESMMWIILADHFLQNRVVRI